MSSWNGCFKGSSVKTFVFHCCICCYYKIAKIVTFHPYWPGLAHPPPKMFYRNIWMIYHYHQKCVHLSQYGFLSISPSSKTTLIQPLCAKWGVSPIPSKCSYYFGLWLVWHWLSAFYSSPISLNTTPVAMVTQSQHSCGWVFSVQYIGGSSGLLYHPLPLSTLVPAVKLLL